MDANAFWLPAGIEPDDWIEARFGIPDQSRCLTVPDVTPRLLSQTAKALREARNVGLSRMPVARIVEAIGAAVERWLDPTYHLRQMAEAYLPEITGYSQPMIRHGLPELLRPFQQKGLQAMLHATAGDHAALDDPPTPDHAIADGPRLTSIILAGNIPAVAVESIVHALLLKSSALVKGSSRDPLFPALFAQSIAEADADIGAALAVLWWKGGSPALDAADGTVLSAELPLALVPRVILQAARNAVPGIDLDDEVDLKTRDGTIVYDFKGEVGDQDYELRISEAGVVLRVEVDGELQELEPQEVAPQEGLEF
ncbi:MAG: hypothetical protein IIC82_07195 [Chloroflexi bacterium]|nr:hypothetical protein [Chloroflexota bacterium]